MGGSQSTVYTPTAKFAEQWPAIDWGVKANVRATTLLHWARRTRVSLIDFVYLDVECAELDALRGAGGLLRNASMLYLEISTEQFCNGGPLWPDIERFVTAWGSKHLVLPPRPWTVRFDAIFVRWPPPPNTIARI